MKKLCYLCCKLTNIINYKSSIEDINKQKNMKEENKPIQSDLEALIKNSAMKMQIVMEQDEQIQTKLKTILALSLQSVEILETNWQLYRQGVSTEKEMDERFKDMMNTVQEVKQALKLEELYERK